jgi:hypothetical protein
MTLLGRFVFLAFVSVAACAPDSGADLPIYLRGAVACGDHECAEGEICFSACNGYCVAPGDSGCPPDTGHFGGRCCACSRRCLTVPPVCYATSCSGPEHICSVGSITSCSNATLCSRNRQQSCGPTTR